MCAIHFLKKNQKQQKTLFVAMVVTRSPSHTHVRIQNHDLAIHMKTFNIQTFNPHSLSLLLCNLPTPLPKSFALASPKYRKVNLDSFVCFFFNYYYFFNIYIYNVNVGWRERKRTNTDHRKISGFILRAQDAGSLTDGGEESYRLAFVVRAHSVLRQLKHIVIKRSSLIKLTKNKSERSVSCIHVYEFFFPLICSSAH